MNERIQELAAQCRTATDYGMGKYESFDDKKFAKLIVADCSEMVRGLLREEGSTLSYKDAATLQERFKEAFDIEPDWSEP